jgi:signal transduction histidine kinase
MLKQFELQAKRKGIQLSFTNVTLEDVIHKDKFMISQIIQEIIDNAIKFTNKGTVTISEFSDDQDRIIVSVTDTGIGMSDEFLQKIFNPFTQEYSGYSRKYEGNGLALALVKKYAELNNLDIHVESAKDIGSEFRIVFNN